MSNHHRRVMIVGLHPAGLVALCAVSTPPQQQEQGQQMPSIPEDMPPLPPGVTMEEVMANETAPQTNGFTDLEWKMALNVFEDKLAHTPEEERDQPIGDKDLSPNQIVAAVREKSELGARVVASLIRQLAMQDAIASLLGIR